MPHSDNIDKGMIANHCLIDFALKMRHELATLPINTEPIRFLLLERLHG